MFDISIHAPTRGATAPGEASDDHLTDFNPRSHERSDLMHPQLTSLVSLFQSTLPREERHIQAQRLLHPYLYFNPRSHERSDNVRYTQQNGSQISIHAPTRGATKVTRRTPCIFGFQSTLPREERPMSTANCLLCKHFNPRSHERSDDSSVEYIRR